jgi:hypothetical protein
LFVGFGGAGRRENVAEEAAVYIEGPGLASLLPLALSAAGAERLAGTPYAALLQAGIRDLETGRVTFKDEAHKQRVLHGHNGRQAARAAFGE